MDSLEKSWMLFWVAWVFSIHFNSKKLEKENGPYIPQMNLLKEGTYQFYSLFPSIASPATDGSKPQKSNIQGTFVEICCQ